MRLHRRLGDAELVGDLLVEQPLRPSSSARAAAAASGCASAPPARRPRSAGAAASGPAASTSPPSRMASIASRIIAGGEDFGTKPAAPSASAAADRAGILARRHDADRHGGELCPEIHQSGKAPRARHGEVEEHQIGLVRAPRLRRRLRRAFRPRRCARRQNAARRLPQRIAEERMVVRHDEGRRIACHPDSVRSHSRLQGQMLQVRGACWKRDGRSVANPPGAGHP